MSSAEVIVVGAGTAGLAAASELATRGARVVLVEKSERIGGTLHVSAGQMSGAGTRLQKARGIHDTPDLHFADAMRISKGTADPALVRRAVDLAPDTIDWLMDEGFDLDPVCPAILHYHEAYRLARTYWGREGGRSILAVLERVFGRAREIGRIDLRFGARLVGLEGTPGSAVTGIRIAAADGRETSIAADAVILASGGYGADRGRFARWTGGRPMFSACMPTSTGDGIAIAETFGARVDGGDLFLPTFGGVESEPGGGRVIWDELPQLTPQSRPPWEIYVDTAGRRFVAEDHPSVDARETALLEKPDLTFWIVYDSKIARTAPPLLPGWPERRLDAAFAGHSAFVRADTLGDLAARTGLPAAALAESVAAYNAALVRGSPDPLGRTHRPAPIVEPPFLAVKSHGIVLKTPAGIRIDDQLRVLGADAPIEGLYAIGEAIGGSRLSGKSFVGGMSVTPALSFGRWIARRLASGG
ncbi:MAG: FAD-dependent oxidoreductase [Alphaproteobacteria bacterium]|nr:FAD-dependent oxidoreductase [Alphaproteobacteria bacterium]